MKTRRELDGLDSKELEREKLILEILKLQLEVYKLEKNQYG